MRTPQNFKHETARPKDHNRVNAVYGKVEDRHTSRKVCEDEVFEDIRKMNMASRGDG